MWWSRDRRAAKAERQMERLCPDPGERRRVERPSPPRDYEAIVGRKLSQLYPDEKSRRQAEKALRKCRWGDDPRGIKKTRVHLAILRLAGSNLEEVKKFVETANGDPRDVIAWAEYPSQMGARSSLSKEERLRIAEEDLDAYETWIAADSSPSLASDPGP
jgi:hypothetical protein